MATNRLHLPLLLIVAGLHLINTINVKKGNKGLEVRERDKMDDLEEDYEEFQDSEDLVMGSDEGERKGKKKLVCKMKKGGKWMKYKEGEGPPEKDCIQRICVKKWNQKNKMNVMKWKTKISDKCQCTPNDENVEKWNYGSKGPSKWKILFPDYCSGNSQSPIDIVPSDAVANDTGPITFTNYDIMFKAKIVNNGHSVAISKVCPNEGSTIEQSISGGRLRGQKFAFDSLHWHWGSNSSHGSEHTMEGNKFPMELHVVHWNIKYNNFKESLKHSDGLAVLGFFYNISEEDNPDLQPLVDKLQSLPSSIPSVDDSSISSSMEEYYDGDSPTIQVNLDQFLPMKDMRKEYYYYDGSLTTPKCNEVVLWTVFKEPLPISKPQIKKFRGLMNGNHAIENNFRPTQPLNNRTVYYNS